MRGMKRYVRVMMRGMRTMMLVMEGDEVVNSNVIIGVGTDFTQGGKLICSMVYRYDQNRMLLGLSDIEDSKRSE